MDSFSLYYVQLCDYICHKIKAHEIALRETYVLKDLKIAVKKNVRNFSDLRVTYLMSLTLSISDSF